MEISRTELEYILISFFFALILACFLILIKINYKESSNSSIFFAVFFLTFYFYQPLLIILDRLKAYVLYYSDEVPHFAIEEFLKIEYVIIGYIGTFFSNVFLPIHKNVTISGYETFWERLKDALSRFRDKNFKYIVILVLYILLSYLLYLTNDKDQEIKKTSKEFFSFLLNCIIVLDFFKAIWYLGAYLPLLFGELKIEYKLCQNCTNMQEYVGQITQNMEKYLEEDKKKLEEAYEDLIYIIYFFLRTQILKEKYKDLIQKIEANKDSFKLKLKSKQEIEKLSKSIDKLNYEDKLASAIRKIIKTLSKIPRKIYEYEDLTRKLSQNNKGCYNEYPFCAWILIGFGLIIFAFEVSLPYYDYHELSSPFDFEGNFIFAFCVTFLYFAVIYYSFLNTNSLTTQNIYGIKQSDTLCLLNFAEGISGLITPITFLAVGTKAAGFFDLRENMTFMKTFDIPIVENIFIGLKFEAIYYTYIVLRSFTFSISFFMNSKVNTFFVPNCCKKGKYLFYRKINDKNTTKDDKGCCKICCL